MSEASTKIAALIREGKKIEAIKLLRETTGLDLKQAKEEIDRLSEDLTGQALSPTATRLGGTARSGALSQEVEDLARQGKKIQAIKLHREQTGLGLKEAKEEVEKGTGQGGSGCMPVFLLLLVVGVSVVAILAAHGL